MGDHEHPEPSLFALHRIPNGLVVLLTVALLLQGPAGVFDALSTYTSNVLRTLFGGEELFWEVLCQTAPLALATASIAFAYRCGLLSLSSPTSLVASSVLLLAGTWIGAELRSLSAKKQSVVQSGTAVIPVSVRTGTRVLFTDRSPPEFSDRRSQTETISVAAAIQQLSDFQSATDASHHRWDQQIPRVALISETGAVPGIVSQAVNQILGYFVVYRPRLFLAAILLGGYIGWSWHPYFASLRSWVNKNTNRTTLQSP